MTAAPDDGRTIGAPAAVEAAPTRVSAPPEHRERMEGGGSIAQVHQRLMLPYTPVSVIVNADGDIIDTSGDVGRFLRLQDGAKSANLLNVIPPDLKGELRAASLHARHMGRLAEARRVPVTLQGAVRLVDMFVQPLDEPELAHGALLVVLQDVGVAAAPPPASPKVDVRLTQLESELHPPKFQQRATIEQSEAAVQEQTAATTVLPASEARLRLALDIAELGTWTWNLASGAGYLDARGAEIIGLAPGYLPNVAEAQLASIHPDDLARIEAEVAAGIQSGDAFDLAYRVIHPGGSVRHVVSRARVITDAAEQPVQLVGTNRDVTMEREAELRLRESEECFRALLAKGSDMITISDRNGAIVYSSPSTERVSGYTVDEFIGSNPFADGIHPDDMTRCREALDELIATPGLSLTLQHRARHKSGAWHWYEGTFTSLFHDPAVGGLVANVHDITERKQAEDALRESEERFRLMADAVPQIIWLTDPAGRTEFFNKQWMRYTGVPFEPATSAEVAASFVHPDDATMTVETFAQARRNGSPFEVEHRIRSATGTYRWFLVRAEPYRDQQTGEIIRWFGASIDIHDRKLAEAASRESEERLQKAISIETVGVIFFNLAGEIYDANQAFQRMSGYGHEDFQRRRVRWDVVTPPEFMPATLKAKAELLTKGENTPYEKQYIRPDGSRWWGLFAGKRLSSSECVEFVLDITERKQAEEALRESEAGFRAVADVVPDLLWSSDARGLLEWYNQRWFDYTGQTPDQARGTGWLDAIHPDDRDPSLYTFQAAIAAGQPLRQEHRIRRADRTYRWFLSQAQPLRNEGGTIMRWYGAWTDIHQERMALAEAEAALKTRDQFLSIASHELRTPLTSLLGYAHMLPIALSQGKGDPAKMAGMIARQAERLNALVDHLLDVSRLQRGQFAVERQPVDLRVLAAQVVDEFRVAHKLDAKHPIELLRADEPVTVAGDGPRLEQVLRNLLSNAVKYSPHGGPVQVHVTRTPMEAVLEVADRGIGIPAQAQAHLFDAFYRARNVGSQISGFGLGLHIVHEIVQRHGGRIEVDSTEGVGSTFRVVLPRHQSDGPNSDSA